MPLRQCTDLPLVDLHVDSQARGCACACGTLLLYCARDIHQLSSLAIAPTSLSLYLHCAVPPLSTQYNGHVIRPSHGGPVSKVRVWVGLSLGAATFVLQWGRGQTLRHAAGPMILQLYLTALSNLSPTILVIMSMDLQMEQNVQ